MVFQDDKRKSPAQSNAGDFQITGKHTGIPGSSIVAQFYMSGVTYEKETGSGSNTCAYNT